MSIIGILFFIIILSIIIFVHELGHLISAKFFGVYVHEFSIGMGPKLITLFTDKSGTKYNIRIIPIGGFVQIAGEDIDKQLDVNIKADKKLDNQAWWKQIIILFAGTFNNILLSWLIFIILAYTNLTPHLGVDIFSYNAQGLAHAISIGSMNFISLCGLMFQAIGAIFTQGINNLGGIVFIADQANVISQQSIGLQLYFLAFLSLNIGIVNQFPIPMLDGGRILIVLYQKIFNRRISKKAENILMNLSLAFLIFIFLFTTIKDIFRIWV